MSIYLHISEEITGDESCTITVPLKDIEDGKQIARTLPKILQTMIEESARSAVLEFHKYIQKRAPSSEQVAKCSQDIVLLYSFGVKGITKV